MRSKLATYALAGALGLTGVAGAALAVPAASYAATGDSTAVADRVTSITQALAGLVTDGTITQEQADSVATTLAERLPGRGGPGGKGLGRDLAPVLEELGVTAEELQAAAEAGTTLGALADEQGVARDALVDALVAAGQERLAQAVTDGRLPQAEADEKAATLEERATAALEQPVRLGRGGRGGHSHGPRGEEPGSATGTPATPEAEASSGSA